MITQIYSDDDLGRLRNSHKRVDNPNARWTEKPASSPVHRQRSFTAVSGGDNEDCFEIYERQNLVDPSDFSCGIAYVPISGKRVTLARYNGPSHEHGEISYRPHIHRASEQAMRAGKKPEHEAAETDQYNSLSGALACLVRDFNIVGLPDKELQEEMF